ncbi:MAG: hypothetical protein ACRDQ2_19800 [Gaiellales bacterium]
MDRRILAIVLALVLVAVAVGIGTQLYQAGVARGLAESTQTTPRPEGVSPYRYYAPYGYHPFGFGFGFFGFLFPLLFFFLIFALLRGLFWRPWGWHGPWKYGVPPALEEWHRKAHESPQQGQKI